MFESVCVDVDSDTPFLQVLCAKTGEPIDDDVFMASAEKGYYLRYTDIPHPTGLLEKVMRPIMIVYSDEYFDDDGGNAAYAAAKYGSIAQR